MDPQARLCVLIGIPGVGKSSVAHLLRPHLPPRWTVFHGDDFIGVTPAIYPGKPWEEVRRYSPLFVGWSTGWYLAGGRGVLLEGHLRDLDELDRLMRGVKDFYPGCPPPTVVQLVADPEKIAARLAENPARALDWQGPTRESDILAWLNRNPIDPGIQSTKVRVEGLGEDAVARTVAQVFGLEWA